MAKLPFSKLKLTKTAMTEISSLVYEDQTIEVKHYLPIHTKTEMVTRIINSSITDQGYANPVSLEVFFALEVVFNYTNLSFTDKQKENPEDLFDLLDSNGLLDMIAQEIPESEYQFLYESVMNSAATLERYNLSALGLVDAVMRNREALSEDVQELAEKLADPKNLALLNEILTKLG